MSCDTGYFLVNQETGKSIPLKCNTYSCPECGPLKAAKLKKAMSKYLSTWKHRNMWTFTMSNAHGLSIRDHAKQLSVAWHKFITYIRRSKSLSHYQRNFRYIKCMDLHKTGFVHYHVLVDCYLSWHALQPIWENICQELLGTDKHCSSCYVKSGMSYGKAAYYAAKYVLKVAAVLTGRIRRYSTSYGIKIFEKKKSSGLWVCVRSVFEWAEGCRDVPPSESSLLVLHTHNCTEKEYHDYIIPMFPELDKQHEENLRSQEYIGHISR